MISTAIIRVPFAAKSKTFERIRLELAGFLPINIAENFCIPKDVDEFIVKESISPKFCIKYMVQTQPYYITSAGEIVVNIIFNLDMNVNIEITKPSVLML